MAFKSIEDRRKYAREYYHRNKSVKDYWKYDPDDLHRREMQNKWDRENYDPIKARSKNKKFRTQNPDYSKQWYQRNKIAHCSRTRARHKSVYVPHPGFKYREAKLAGFRSGFERTLDQQLRSSGVGYSYETMKIAYVLEGTYNPDFILDNGIIIEAKGYLDAVAKRKMIAVKKQHPELDIRFVFQSSATKVAGGKQTNADWARKNGFQHAEQRIPEEWFDK